MQTRAAKLPHFPSLPKRPHLRLPALPRPIDSRHSDVRGVSIDAPASVFLPGMVFAIGALFLSWLAIAILAAIAL